MKNLMDFCIGTVVFSLLGYTIMMGEDTFFGLIGIPNLDMFTHFKEFISSPGDGSFTGASTFVFNLVFCATTATIVSGAMAGRTKFSSYCIYSAVISLFIYPIEAHWIWGGGWLSKLGFHDYAGSCAIHMVGGIAALIGASMLGERIGKYERDKDGKVVKVNAIPGHSITLGALGVFILWLGWYGFNGAAATSVSELSSIFITTTIAPSIATVTTMIYTWVKNGKPDVSMCLNASLAGLVGVTAGTDAFDAIGAAVVDGKRYLGNYRSWLACKPGCSRRLEGTFLHRRIQAAGLAAFRLCISRSLRSGDDDHHIHHYQKDQRTSYHCRGGDPRT